MSILEKIHIGSDSSGGSPVAEVDDVDYAETIEAHPMVVVEFCRRWLGLCRKFARIFSQSAKDHPEAFFVKMDVKKSPQAAARLGARCLPTVMTILNGDVIERHCGTVTAVTLHEMVTRLRDAGSGGCHAPAAR